MKVKIRHQHRCEVGIESVRIIPFGKIIQVIVDTHYKWPVTSQMTGDGEELIIFFYPSEGQGVDQAKSMPYGEVALTPETPHERELLKRELLIDSCRYGCSGFLVPRPSQRQFERGQFVKGPVARKPKRKAKHVNKS